MITVVGPRGAPELEAAEQIASALEKLWPGISDSDPDQEQVKISAGVKLSGYRVSDIDIVIAARLAPSRFIVPRTVFIDRDQNKVSGAKIAVHSFVAAIEVKDHDTTGIRVEAGGVNVRYKGGWKSATDQNDQQRYALKEYLSDRLQAEPFVYRCVMLRGINTLPSHRGRSLPSAGAVASDFDATKLLLAMATVNGVPGRDGRYFVSSGNSSLIQSILDTPIFNSIVPSQLDRRRMDRIAKRPDEAKRLGALLGEERVHLRGKGGTGKTVLLLQAAAEAYQQHGKRCLLLTYNHALAADIKRLLALLGIPASADQGGVDVRTVMSFTYAWLSRLGVLEEDSDPNFEKYDALCSEALRMFQHGAVTDKDVRDIKLNAPESFDYDAVIVDEAQDWPQQEADLVSALYGGNRVSLADGVEQLVRGRPTNWNASIGGQRATEFQHLNECLRMKSNLATFANAVALTAGLNWKVEPSSQAAGGRVIICSGTYASKEHLRAELIELAKAQGNSPVDLLHCVPASGVSLLGNRRVSTLAGVFATENLQTWDGVDTFARRDFPRNVNELRIVQYESCRGLEGWTTILDGFDEFWERKREVAIAELHSSSMDGPIDLNAEADAIAWRWVMIALTRPIDTLVICLNDPGSRTGKLLASVARQHPDIVELHS